MHWITDYYQCHAATRLMWNNKICNILYPFVYATSLMHLRLCSPVVPLYHATTSRLSACPKYPYAKKINVTKSRERLLYYHNFMGGQAVRQILLAPFFGRFLIFYWFTRYTYACLKDTVKEYSDSQTNLIKYPLSWASLKLLESVFTIDVAHRIIRILLEWKYSTCKSHVQQLRYR